MRHGLPSPPDVPMASSHPTLGHATARQRMHIPWPTLPPAQHHFAGTRTAQASRPPNRTPSHDLSSRASPCVGARSPPPAAAPVTAGPVSVPVPAHGNPRLVDRHHATELLSNDLALTF